ncbi:SprT-like domain-containing protein [Salinibaculum salinum]|uniref:SprT-like domain-containing protein n=1 Tax=Salinibaculum salinum TaxID=3131996 RepID=UPI0030EB16C8
MPASSHGDSDGPTRVDVDWYSLDESCSHEEFLAVARVYAREVVAEYDLSASVSDLTWEVSTRAKRRAGAVKYRDGDPVSVTLTWAHFANRGWAATAATIRHELIHVHLLNEHGDASHGERFCRLAERLHTHVHCDRFVPPEWWVVCTDCGARLARYRQSKLVTDPAQYRCGDCGGAFRVERNDDCDAVGDD